MMAGRKDSIQIAVVGATGAVGRRMLEVLEARAPEGASLRAVASARSAGKALLWRGERVIVESLEGADFGGVEIALMSAGTEIARAHAERIARAGAVVIDNSSAWRADERVPLVVPEVNAEAIERRPLGIIANPNCSTIQAVCAVSPIARRFGLERVLYATYQSASGAGQAGLDALEAHDEARGPFDRALAGDVLPWIGSGLEDGSTSEERKMRDETRRILGAPDLEVSAICVRVPVAVGHAVAVTLDVSESISIEEARNILAAAPGIQLRDGAGDYPSPRQAAGTDPVWVGRVRLDPDRPRTLHIWVVADNLLKGAALNAVQIAERLDDRFAPPTPEHDPT